MERIEGMDVSHWNGPINWDAVPSQYRVVWIKATEGTSFVDGQFENNMRGSQGKLWRAPYHFFRPSIDAKRQAYHFLEYIHKFTFEAPPVGDFETTDGMLPADRCIDWLITFLETVYQGYPRVAPMTYSADWFLSRFSATARLKLKKFQLWAAQWPFDNAADILSNFETYRLRADVFNPKVPAPWESMLIWQWSAKGRVPGVAADPNRPGVLTSVDMNLAMLSEYELGQLWNVPDPPPPPVTFAEWAAELDEWARKNGYQGVHPPRE